MQCPADELARGPAFSLRRRATKMRFELLAPTIHVTLKEDGMSDPGVEKVVVMVELSRYSDICNQLEQQLDVSAVGALNDQIKEQIGLAGAGIKPSRQPYKSTGDGALGFW